MEETLTSVVQKGVEHALSLIAQRYDRKVPFHRQQHTLDVMRRTELLANATRLSIKEVNLARLAAAFHDVVINSNAYVPSYQGKRIPVVAELHSIRELSSWAIRSYPDVILKEDRTLMANAISATFPRRHESLATTIQPLLHENSHPVVRCVALADLGTAGMDGGKAFLAESRLRFLEKNLDIYSAITLSGNNRIFLVSQKAYKKRMLEWLCMQLPFIEGRRQRLEVELGNWDSSTKDRVRNLFCHFDDSKSAIEKAIQDQEKENFSDAAEVLLALLR